MSALTPPSTCLQWKEWPDFTIIADHVGVDHGVDVAALGVVVPGQRVSKQGLYITATAIFQIDSRRVIAHAQVSSCEKRLNAALTRSRKMGVFGENMEWMSAIRVSG